MESPFTRENEERARRRGKKEGQTCQDGVEVYSAWFVFDPFVIIIGVMISVE